MLSTTPPTTNWSEPRPWSKVASLPSILLHSDNGTNLTTPRLLAARRTPNCPKKKKLSSTVSQLQTYISILEKNSFERSIFIFPFRTKICCRPKETRCPQKGSRSCRCLGWTILPRSSPCPYCFPTRSNRPMRRIHPWRQRTRLLRQKTQGQEIQINVKIRINEFLSQRCFIFTLQDEL